jgi:hypothetical protein
MLRQEEQKSFWKVLIQLFSKIKLDNLPVMTKQQICI